LVLSTADVYASRVLVRITSTKQLATSGYGADHCAFEAELDYLAPGEARPSNDMFEPHEGTRPKLRTNPEQQPAGLRR
jgi:hypothetical protein